MEELQNQTSQQQQQPSPPPSDDNLLASLQAQLDQSKAELARLQIESESELNSSNARINDLESKLANQSDLRSQLDRSLEEIQKLKTSLDSRSQNDHSLNHQLQNLQSEKSDLLRVLRDKESELNDLEAELSSRNQQLSSSKTTIRELETSLQTTQTSERALRLQAQTFQSEAALACSDRDFYSKELERTREESHVFRSETHQRTTHLQNELDNLTFTHQSTTETLTTLRAQHTELQKLHSDSLEKVKQLTNQSIEAEAAFQKEIEAQKRVTTLMDRRDKQRSERMERIEKEYHDRKLELDDRERMIDEALENERTRVGELTQELADTRNALNRLCADADPSIEIDETQNIQPGLMMGDVSTNTPFGNRIAIGSPASRSIQNEMRFALTNGLSPAAAMASKLQKTGKSLTDVYTEKIALEEELNRVQFENSKLSEAMTQILAEIQDRAPLLHQQRMEHERIEKECVELTTQLTEAIEQKEEAERLYKSCTLDLNGAQRDYELANDQLNDLSHQVRVLSVELNKLQQANGNQYMIIKGDESDLDKDLDDWRNARVEEEEDVLLSNDLVTFRDIADLQQKNLKLLLIVRKLSNRVTEIEEKRLGALNGQDEEEDAKTKQTIEEAHELIITLKTDLGSAQQKSEALSRERDMLRKMLNQSQSHSTSNLESLPSSIHLQDITTTDPDGSSSNQKLEELKIQFDIYRTEIGRDSKQLNEDLNLARSDLSRTQVSLAKANAQIEYLTERQRSLDQTNAMHAKEVQTLTTSSAKLQDHISKSEMLLHQANENVTELKAKCHVLQHQVTSLTSEKEVWKGVEARLLAENSGLTRERNNMNDILRNVQVMQSEIERNSDDSRRRLESQLSKAEVQLSELKEKLKAEVDSVRQSTLQRQIESREYQTKIDKLSGEHLTARENLSAASAAKSVLETQVAHLQKQLSMKEERLAVYEGHRRLDPRSNQVGDRSTPASNDPSLTREQRLEIELSELKIELAATKEECARAQQHVEQFKAISQSAEAALLSLTTTHDEYKRSQEAELERKESTLGTLKEHLRKVTEDLSAATTQNSELHRQLESQRVEFEKEKLALNNKLVDLEEVEARVNARESELRAEANNQMKLAQDSHDRYQAEVQNHANSLNELKHVKAELETANEAILEAKTAAQTATTKLNSSETSWLDQKTTLQKELANIQTRCDDLVKQNNLLHEHLETVSAQATKLSNQTLDTLVGPSESGDQKVSQINANENMVESVEQLRGVIRYLRNNYDIAQQQIELSKMESARLQQQLQHASKALDQTKLELNHEREKNREGYVPSSEHAKLLDQINTLNMIRESNITLRDEANRSERKSKQLEERLKQTTETIEPLRQELRELKLTLHQYQQEIGILNEDNERWKLRNQQILEKYDRIDPAEVQGLHDEIKRLKQELHQSREDLAQTQHYKEKFFGLQVQARNIRQKSNDEKIALEAKLNAVNEELEKVKEAVRNLENEAKAFPTQTNVAVEQATSQAREQLDALRQEKATTEKNLSDALEFKQKAIQTQSTLDAIKFELEKVKTALQSRENDYIKLLTENNGTTTANKQLNDELSKLRAEASQKPVVDGSEAAIENEVVRRLEQKLAESELAVGLSTGGGGSEEFQEQLLQIKREAAAEKEEAVRKVAEETTQRLTEKFSQAQTEAVERAKAELQPSTVGAIPEVLVEERVTARLAEIQKNWESAAKSKEEELTKKFEAELEQARKVQAQNPSSVDPKQPTVEQLQEITKVAVDTALKAQEAELSKSFKVSAEATSESTKKVMAEIHSKHSVVQMQLRRSHAKNQELATKISELQSELDQLKQTQQTSQPSNTDTTNTPIKSLTATTPSFVPNAPSTSQPAVETTGSSASAGTVGQNPPGTVLPTTTVPTTGTSLGFPVKASGSVETNATSEGSIRGSARGRGIMFGNRGMRPGGPGMMNRGGLSQRGGAPGNASHLGGAGNPATNNRNGAGGPSRNNNSSELPAEGRMMADRPVAQPPPQQQQQQQQLLQQQQLVSIRGAAIKKGGAGNLLGMAMKQATGSPAGENPSHANLGLSTVVKRAREDEGPGSMTAAAGPGGTIVENTSLKRAKGLNNLPMPSTPPVDPSPASHNPLAAPAPATAAAANSANELASRLSKRP